MQDVSQPFPNDVQEFQADRFMNFSCVAAKQLPLGTDVEIECIAVLP
jgi:enamine deaminase RidA (YjgF/YER057c/UK114 family)